jgi:hypothetical protein
LLSVTEKGVEARIGTRATFGDGSVSLIVSGSTASNVPRYSARKDGLPF